MPLQYHAREDSNTVFLDNSLEPFPDQWGFLASLVPVRAEKVERIATEATTRGQVIGLQVADTGDDDFEARLWLRSPSRKRKLISAVEPVPSEVQGALSQRLYIEKGGLPSPLIVAALGASAPSVLTVPHHVAFRLFRSPEQFDHWQGAVPKTYDPLVIL